MIELQKRILYGALIAVSFLLWQSWVTENTNKDINSSNRQALEVQQQQNAATQLLPRSHGSLTTPNRSLDTSQKAGRFIDVHTDLMRLTVDTLGGNIVSAALLKYPNKLDTPNDPFMLLKDAAGTRYIAQSGLIGNRGPDTPSEQSQYQADAYQYTLPSGEEVLRVPLKWQDNAGLTVTKLFEFKRGSYLINIKYMIDNNSPQAWEGYSYNQLLQRKHKKTSNSLSKMLNVSSYEGAALSTTAKPYQKISFKEIEANNLDKAAQGGWIALLQHYFLAAWIPSAEQSTHYYTRFVNPSDYIVGMMGPKVDVPANGNITLNNKIYLGPKLADQLQQASPHLELTVDYGWLWFISNTIFWLMQKIHALLGNWGWSIVLVTLLIKLAFYRLSASSYRSMAGMRKLQPRMEAIKQRYGDDRQKLSQAMMELYRKEKINPLGGCLPIIVQIPVFIALYWVLAESVQLRQAPFILWIKDLSAPDPYYVLPILMGITMLLQQRLNPKPPDPMQARVMMLLPVLFTFLFLYFPAGLVLYWVVNNILSILQQWYITYRFEVKGLPGKAAV